VMLGLLAELQVRTYHESQSKPIYLVKERVGFDSAMGEQVKLKSAV
jgi:hypothetical protein